MDDRLPDASHHLGSFFEEGETVVRVEPVRIASREQQTRQVKLVGFRDNHDPRSSEMGRTRMAGVSSGTSDRYQSFADREARGSSEIYFAWASAVAGDGEVLALIEQLPLIKQQPNLVFAAARYLGAPVGPFDPFREWLVTNWSDVGSVCLDRSTQTNEAARCGVLLPALSTIPGPLSLIEVGASAGLCLFPDAYSYRYDAGDRTVDLDPSRGVSTVMVPCRIDAPEVPARLPEVAWRAGLDLNPIDVRNPSELEWLETLIWPEHEARRQRLHAAAALVAQDPPHIAKGDLLNEIGDLIGAAPADATTVVFHSAVLAYLDAHRVAEFVDLIHSFRHVVWISNEGEHVLPTVERQLPHSSGGRTVVAMNGTPMAFAGPHGQSYEAL